MSRYRTTLIVLALLVVATVTPLRPTHIRDLNPEVWQGIQDGAAFRRALAKTDAAENFAAMREDLKRIGRYLIGTPARAATPEPAQPAAEAARPAAIASGAPMQFADFVGSWHHHGYSLTIYPDGSAVAVWRTYDGDLPEAPGGNATLRFDRVEGRTLYGTVLATTYVGARPARAELALTEYEYGVGFLTDPHDVAAPNAPYNPQDGMTLCGPRFATAPEWFRGTAPCGA